MIRKTVLFLALGVGLTLGLGCAKKQAGSGGSSQTNSGTCSTASGKETCPMKFTGAKGEVILMTLDPGHFHAALVQKSMYDQISPDVYVFAPEGPDVQDHLNRIKGFNTRKDNPTTWNEIVYTGPDFLEKMISERPGNVVVLAGNNKKKTEYIKACADAGLNIFSDKPMCINKKGFDLLVQAFESAKKHGVLLYDIMTERHEVTTRVQKDLVNNPAIIGEVLKGSPDAPAVEIKSVHHFSKLVAGNPIKRPGWYFDVTQEGEGIVDVTTHLVDIAMWKLFPNQAIDYKKDIDVLNAKHWPTAISLEQFSTVTRLKEFPDYLKPVIDDKGMLQCYANGEFVYTLKGINIKISVEWHYKAPEGAGDTHFSAIRGSKANIYIKQGKEQNYKPEVYVEPAKGTDPAELEKTLTAEVEKMKATYPGIGVVKAGSLFMVTIPDKLRIGHEAHFAQVTKKYLSYLVAGKMPDWEVPNMIAKYYTTTKALELAQANK